MKWREQVDQIMGREYSITTTDAGFTDEELARFEEVMTPEEFVSWIAEKYDLVSLV